MLVPLNAYYNADSCVCVYVCVRVCVLRHTFSIHFRFHFLFLHGKLKALEVYIICETESSTPLANVTLAQPEIQAIDAASSDKSLYVSGGYTSADLASEILDGILDMPLHIAVRADSPVLGMLHVL